MREDRLLSCPSESTKAQRRLEGCDTHEGKLAFRLQRALKKTNNNNNKLDLLPPTSTRMKKLRPATT